MWFVNLSQYIPRQDSLPGPGPWVYSVFAICRPRNVFLDNCLLMTVTTLIKQK
jgi:hypothetical protein